MLTRLNEKLRESQLNDSINYLDKHKQLLYKLSNSTGNNYLPPNEPSKLHYDNLVDRQIFNFKSSISPIEPFNYDDPIDLKSDMKSKPTVRTVMPTINGNQPNEIGKKKGETTIKGSIDEPIKLENVSTDLKSGKVMIPVKLPQPIKSKSGRSTSFWSLSDRHHSDNDSISYSIAGLHEMGRCERIGKYLFRLKTVLLILSVIGLVYQTLELSETYFRYPTIVDVLVEHNDKVILPSITICSPIQIAPSELEKLFTDRVEVKRVLSQFDSDTKMKLDERQAKKFDYLRKYLQSYYLSRVTVNLSSYLEKSVQESKFVHSCDLSIMNSSDAQIKLPCKNFSHPMVTFTTNEKCFTYFSENNKHFDSIDNVISFDEDGSAATAQVSVILRLNVAFDSNYDINLPSFLYIHASNDIMAKSNKYSLEPNRKYDVFYWRSVSERLAPLYCRSYSSSINYPQSQIDCVNRCSTEYTFLYCRCLLFKPPLRIETVPLSARICPQSDNNFIKSCRRMLQGMDSKACRTRCTSGCIEEVFDFSVTAHEFTAEEIMKIGNSINQSDLIEILVTRKLKPDVIYKQKYQLEFEQYFSNFCSLLGFWLGITVLTFYDQIKKNVILLYRLTCYVKTRMKHKRRKIKPKIRKI